MNNIYINIIFSIVIIYLLYKVNKLSKERFTTNEPDITITESIKNLGIIAQQIVNDEILTLPSNISVEGSINAKQIKIVDKTDDNKFITINSDGINLVGDFNISRNGEKVIELTNDGINISRDGEKVIELTNGEIKLNKNITVDGTITAQNDIKTMKNVRAKGKVLFDKFVSLENGLSIDFDSDFNLPKLLWTGGNNHLKFGKGLKNGVIRPDLSDINAAEDGEYSHDIYGFRFIDNEYSSAFLPA